MLDDLGNPKLWKDNLKKQGPSLNGSPRKLPYTRDYLKEKMKYITSKYTLLNGVIQDLGYSKEERDKQGFSSLEQQFVFIKVETEELRESIAQNEDIIAIKLGLIEVGEVYSETRT